MVKQMTLISIVVPVFNEEENILPFYKRTKKVLQRMGVSWEYVFVNDGSGGESLSVLKKLAKKDVSVKYIDLTRNFGQQAALTAGMDYANGNAVITMDCDLQDPPELIEKMVTKWSAGASIVYARRTVRNPEKPFYSLR